MLANDFILRSFVERKKGIWALMRIGVNHDNMRTLLDKR